MPAKMIPFHDNRNLYKPTLRPHSAMKVTLGKRKGLSYTLCLDLSVIPGFDSKPQTVIAMPAAKLEDEDGRKALKTKAKRR